MKVVILDRNLAVLDYFSLLLKVFEVEVKTFINEKECITYLNQNRDVDFIFIEEFFYKKFLDKYLDSFLIILSFEIKELNMNRIYYKIKKDILPLEFNARFLMIKKLREYFLKDKKEIVELNEVLTYKDTQEEIATQKQLKLFSNELSMFYENDFLIETYFNSKDILSGDALITKRIDENRYFVAVIDAMGKGIGASLTSSNSVGFLNYALTQALKYKDFNFSKLIESFVNYVKSILIKNEALCFVIGYIENNKFTYTNFGMPPIYIDRKKVKANNMPLIELSSDIKIDTIEYKDDILLYSDGLVECFTKEEELYLIRFHKLLPKFTFLRDIIKDFKVCSIQSDDTTIIYIKKDKFSFNKIYEKEIKISIENINEFLKNSGINITQTKQKEKIEFILQELLMNSYEHSLLKLRRLKDSVFRDYEIKIDTKKKSIKAKINIYENNKFIKIEYSDNGEGFNIDILKTLSDDMLHGRGIKMIRAVSDGVFYNYKGNGIIIFLSKD
jgi:serine phosphatase RsbU (regulator of sigma subunit)